MKILGIETSCDETAAAVVEDGVSILSNQVASQVKIHARYGGIVPEVASRQHILAIIPIIEQAMAEVQVTWDDLDREDLVLSQRIKEKTKQYYGL